MRTLIIFCLVVLAGCFYEAPRERDHKNADRGMGDVDGGPPDAGCVALPERPEEVQVDPPPGWTSFGLGSESACGIFNGDLYCWGDCRHLGVSDVTCEAVDSPGRRRPPVQVLPGQRWRTVEIGGDVRVCALSDEEPEPAIYCWANNQPKPSAVFLPPELAGLGPWRVGDGTIAVGNTSDVGFVCALRADPMDESLGRLVCWEDGCLGCSFLGDVRCDRVCEDMRVVGDQRWKAISAYGQVLCGLDENDEAWCWVYNDPEPTSLGPNWQAIAARQDGNALPGFCGVRSAAPMDLVCNFAGFSTNPGDMSPLRVPPNRSVGGTRLDASRTHLCGVSTEGELYCQGHNNSGQLGLPTCDESRDLRRVGPERSWQAVKVAVAGAEPHPRRGHSGFSCATTTAGQLFCFGSDHLGEIGTGEQLPEPPPADVTTPPFLFAGSGLHEVRLGWTSLALGADHGCAIHNRTLYCWGDCGALPEDLRGRCVEGVASPTPVLADRQWLGVEADGFRSCALDTQREINCWDGPQPVRFPTGMVTPGQWLAFDGALAVGSRVCALRRPSALAQDESCDFPTPTTLDDTEREGPADQGELWCWDLGCDECMPVQLRVPDAPTRLWKQVSAAGQSVCGVDAAGFAWCQRGEGPLDRVGEDGWRSITPYDDGSPGDMIGWVYGIREDGAWMYEGGGARESLLDFVVHGAVDVTVGHGCFVDQHHALHCWGHNLTGQLGGTGGSAVIPRVVPPPAGSRGWRQAKVSYTSSYQGLPFCGEGFGGQTCALTLENRLYCWGLNNRGQAGQPTAPAVTVSEVQP